MLKEKNITLRSLILNDLDFLYSIENNSKNWQYGSEEKHFSKEALVSYINNANEDIGTAKQYRFVIDYQNNPIGFIDLFDYTINSAGVGIIIDKKYRERGFAKEALILLIEYTRNTLKIEKLHCNIQNNNIASINLFTSCGFNLQKEKQSFNFYTLTI